MTLRASRGSVIGTPIPDLELHLLDEALRPVPPGALGEIAVGGAGVARGYLGRPELTAERMIAHPFDGAGGRLYLTGDIARRLPDGDIEFRGRPTTRSSCVVSASSWAKSNRCWRSMMRWRRPWCFCAGMATPGEIVDG